MIMIDSFSFAAKSYFKTGIAAGLALVLVNPPSVSAEAAAVPQMQRTPLLEKTTELPGKNITAKVIRVNFPVGFKTPWHTHDGPGPRYVVKGTVKITEDGDENTYAAGQVFWETGRKMMVENIGQEPAEMIIFEMAPANH